MKTTDCCTPPFKGSQYKRTLVGVDDTNGTYAEVTIEKCSTCHKTWLRYSFEIEGISRSGRWYRAIIPNNIENTITPQSALTIIENSDHYYFGGSYFDSYGTLGRGEILI